MREFFRKFYQLSSRHPMLVPLYFLLYGPYNFITGAWEELKGVWFALWFAPAALRRICIDRTTEPTSAFDPSLESRGFIYLFPGFIQRWYWNDLARRRAKANEKFCSCGTPHE